MRYFLWCLLLCNVVSATAQVNLNLGLIAYYPFSGNTNDASGNGNHATNFGAVPTTGQAGVANTAYYFDGVNDFMQVANSPTLQAPALLTMYAKVYPMGFYNGICYNNMIIGKGSPDFIPGNYSLRFTHTTTTNCSVPDTNFQNFRLDLSTGCSVGVINTTPYIQTGNWYCVTGTYDGNTIKMYVNGALRYQCSIGVPIGTNTMDVFIGKMNSIQYPYWFKGKIDEIRLYNRVLNTQEIDSLCNYNPITDTVINHYGAVLDQFPCSNSLLLDTAEDFNVGDTVLMMQIKGAKIDSTNTAAFGTINDYKGAGNYEYNVIAARSGNMVTLKHPVVRVYDIPDGKVQLVSVPSFQHYNVNQPHTCLPWNGSKGGVFAIYVKDTLILNENIDISGKGFRGGINNQNPIQVGPVLCSNPNYFMAPDYDSGSMKAEGIAEISLAKSYGKGKLANGGGGGNAHNGGGGGGGNGGSGGMGGSEYFGCNPNPANNLSGGIGGAQLAYSNGNNKVFMGGGGGSAQSNNLTVSNGGAGGGIGVITAGTLIGNNKTIYANGTAGLECVNNGSFGACHDGMAGGGAGGTLLINTTDVSGNLYTEAKGGKGGDMAANATFYQDGPGGGGSGGVLWLKSPAIPSNIISDFSGGANGIVTYNNVAWGAQPGQGGIALNDLQLGFPVDTFVNTSVTADFVFDRTDCFTFQFTDQSTTVSVPATLWSWDFGGTGGSTLQTPLHTFPGYGTYAVTLTASDINGCSASITREVDIPYLPFAEAGADTTVCKGDPAQLHASGGLNYSWSPPAGLSNPNAALTAVVVTQPAQYVVRVTDSRNCVDVDSVSIEMYPVPVVEARSEGSFSCEGMAVQLEASGAVSFTWQPGIYCNDSTVANPLVRPAQTTLFTVIGTDAMGCTGTDTVTVIKVTGNTRIFMPNAFSPNQDGKNETIHPFIICGFRLEQFAVFNRWGERVFTTNQLNQGWDGMYKHKPADGGAYFYFIRGRKDDGTPFSLKGDFVLIR